MIKFKPSIINISLIFTSLLSVSLIIVSSVYSHQLSVLKREYQIQSGILWIYRKNIVYQQSQNNQQDCPVCEQCEECESPEDCQTPTCDMLQCMTKESCSQFITLPNCQEQYKECQTPTCEICPTSTKSSNLFLLKGTYGGQTYQKVIKFQIASSDNTDSDYTIEEVCAEQDQTCDYTPDNIITLNADGELELTTNNNAVAKLLSDDSTTWTTSSWGMPWSKNAIKVNLPVYASESDVLLQKHIQKIKSSSSVGQIEVDEVGTIDSSSIGTVNSKYTTNINIDEITNINSNNINNITINSESVAKKEAILEGIRQLNSSQNDNGITYISSPKIFNISSNTINTIDTDYALSIKLASVGIDTTKTAIEITNGVSGQIKIEGDISCNSETEACVNLGNIKNANNGYALTVSGNVESPVLFSKDSNISATFTNEGSLSNVVNKGKFNSVQNTGQITNGITNEGTIGDITNQANSNLGSVVNSGIMTSFTNKGTATNIKNEGGTITNGLQINGGIIGSTSTDYGLSINGHTTIQGSDIGILIGNDGSKDDIKIQTQGGVYGILIQQATIGHTGLHRGINIDNRANYNTNSPWVNIYSDSKQFNGQDSYSIFVGPNNVKLHSSTSDDSNDGHAYYYMKPKIHSKYWSGVITAGMHYTCGGEKENN